MSDIYLSITETPTVVTLTNPLISSNVAQSVTVTNVVSVNVVTMPAITVQAAAPAVTTVAGTVAVSNFPASQVVSGSVAVTTMPALSISSVTISNFPSTQTIAGTVTAQLNYVEGSAVGVDGGGNDLVGIRLGFNTDTEFIVVAQNNGLPVQGTVTIGSALPAGTNRIGVVTIGAGTVTLGAGTAQIGSVTASISGTVPISISSVTIGNSVTIASLPAISGTVTANNPSGALTTRFGSVTTANTAQITSAVTNTSRKYLLAQNISAGTVTIGIGFSPTTTQGIQLTAGGGLTFDAFCPTGAVYWLGAVTGAAFTILEG